MPINTAKLAQMIREDVAAIPDDQCATGCGADVLTDYPVCSYCAKTCHFPHRFCLCDACVEQRANDVRVFGDEPPLLADILDERIAA
jgi:predicted amidophosphoribosyltransferase